MKHRAECDGRSWHPWRIPRLPGQFMIVVLGVAALACFASNDSDGTMVSSAHTSQTKAVAYSPDGQSLAVCGIFCDLRVWNRCSSEPVRLAMPIEPQRELILYALAFSPDSRSLAVAGSGLFAIWTLEPDGYRLAFEQEATTYHSAAFSPDGSLLALGTADGSVALWDMPSRRERLVLKAHNTLVSRLAFSGDGRRLMSVGRSIALWDLTRGVAIRLPQEAPGCANLRGAMSPDGSILAQADSMGKGPTVLIDVDSGKTLTTVAGGWPAITNLAFSPDGRTLAGAATDTSIRLWDVATGTEKNRLTIGDPAIQALAFSPDGRTLAFGGKHVPLRIWDLTASDLFDCTQSNTSDNIKFHTSLNSLHF
jgi:WD40 repeat protein